MPLPCAAPRASRSRVATLSDSARTQAKEGGNLGWKRRDELNGVFAEAAFKLAKGKVCARAPSLALQGVAVGVRLCPFAALTHTRTR